MDPGSSLTNPSPSLTPESSLTPEEIEQVICEITGDCEPQTDLGDNGGQCTPPPSPPPTCDPSNPKYPPNQTQQEILEGIQRDLADIDPNIRFQAGIARDLLELGIDLVSYSRELPRNDGSNTNLAEIDIETRDTIIEVLNGRTGSNKLSQIRERINNCEINPDGKVVILYAPNVSPFLARGVEREGALVIRNIQDLIQLLQ